MRRVAQLKKEQLGLVSVAAGKETEIMKKPTRRNLFIEATIIRIKPVEVYFEEELEEKEEAAILKTPPPQSCCSIM